MYVPAFNFIFIYDSNQILLFSLNKKYKTLQLFIQPLLFLTICIKIPCNRITGQKHKIDE